MVKFEVYKGTDGQYHWRLKASNGEIVCWGEAYTTKQSALDSVAWVKSNASIAYVQEI